MDRKAVEEMGRKCLTDAIGFAVGLIRTVEDPIAFKLEVSTPKVVCTIEMGSTTEDADIDD